MQASQLLAVVASKLQAKGYSQIVSPAPIALGMFKQASGLGVPKAVAVIANTDAPNVSFARTAAWFAGIMGRSGAGLLLLAQVGPPQHYINEALGQGHGALGYGQVVCGVYDLSSNTYYLPPGAFGTSHMGWDSEVFG